jgi:plastocyanin
LALHGSVDTVARPPAEPPTVRADPEHEVVSMKTLLLLLVAVVTLGLAAACSEGEDLSAATPVTGVTEVVVKNMKFTPSVIEVPAGTTVTWRFEDGDTPHDVKGDGFKSEMMRSGTFTHTFDEPGTHDYRCTLHSQMTGRVIVTG